MVESHCTSNKDPMAITTTDGWCVPSSDEGSGVQWPGRAQHEEANEPALLRDSRQLEPSDVYKEKKA